MCSCIYKNVFLWLRSRKRLFSCSWIRISTQSFVPLLPLCCLRPTCPRAWWLPSLAHSWERKICSSEALSTLTWSPWQGTPPPIMHPCKNRNNAHILITFTSIYQCLESHSLYIALLYFQRLGLQCCCEAPQPQIWQTELPLQQSSLLRRLLK